MKVHQIGAAPLEDTDKMIEILKHMRRFSRLPGMRMANQMIKALEVFDVAATYQVGGLDQDDSFEEALNLLDKSIVPFFNYHFMGATDSYTPTGSKLAPVKDASTEASPIEETAPEEITPEEIQFPIVDRLDENHIQILGEHFQGIKRNSKFELISLTPRIDVTMNNDTIEATEKRMWAEFNFVRYAGDFTQLEIDKKAENTLDDIMRGRNPKSKYYVRNIKTGDYDPTEEYKNKLSVVKKMDEERLLIVGTGEEEFKKRTRFSLVCETKRNHTTWNGKKVRGIYRKVIAEFDFHEDRGDFYVIELRKDDRTLSQILDDCGKGAKRYVMEQLKGY